MPYRELTLSSSIYRMFSPFQDSSVGLTSQFLQGEQPRAGAREKQRILVTVSRSAFCMNLFFVEYSKTKNCVLATALDFEIQHILLFN